VSKGHRVDRHADSRERAVAATVERASRSLRHLRIAEICELDLQLDGGDVVAYRAKVKDMRETEATYSSEPTPGRRLTPPSARRSSRPVVGRGSHGAPSPSA
jgi:flavin-binding protein dodecin